MLASGSNRPPPVAAAPIQVPPLPPTQAIDSLAPVQCKLLDYSVSSITEVCGWRWVAFVFGWLAANPPVMGGIGSWPAAPLDP